MSYKSTPPEPIHRECIYCKSDDVEEIEPGDFYMTEYKGDYSGMVVLECQDCAQVWIQPIDDNE